MERDVRAGGVAILRQDDLREQQMVRAESRIDGGESGERANEEAGADDQKRRQRDLKSDDGLPDDARVRFDAIGDLVRAWPRVRARSRTARPWRSRSAR